MKIVKINTPGVTGQYLDCVNPKLSFMVGTKRKDRTKRKRNCATSFGSRFGLGKVSIEDSFMGAKQTSRMNEFHRDDETGAFQFGIFFCHEQTSSNNEEFTCYKRYR